MKLQPLFDRVIIRPEKKDEKTVSGLILPSNSEEKSQIATVVAVGGGKIENGNKVEMLLKEGQKVLYSKYAGSEFVYENETYIIIKQTDILAIIE